MRFTPIHHAAIMVCMMSLLLQAQTRARITQLVGKVEVRTANASSWREARIDMPVSEKHDIRTYVESEAELTFETGTKLKIGENSLVTLSRLTADSSSGSTKSTVKVGTGAIWANVKKLTESRSEFDFETPTAVASIRGTNLGIRVDKKSTMVDVFEGLVAVRKKGSRKSVNVAANTRAVVDREKNTIEVMDFKKVAEQEGSGAVPVPVNPYETPAEQGDSLPTINDTAKTIPEVPAEQGSLAPEDEGEGPTLTAPDIAETSEGEPEIVPRTLILNVTSPADDAIIRSPLIVVSGKTTPDAKVYVNDQQISVSRDGSFKLNLPLPDEPNTYNVDIRAEYNGSDRTVARQVTYAVAKKKLFLDCTTPSDGAIISSKAVRVYGKTTPQALVSANRKAMSVSATGVFSGDIPVSEKDIGEYSIEITARDDEDEISKTLTVDISSESPQINTSAPMAVFTSSGLPAITQNVMLLQVLDRTPQDELSITYTNNGSADNITSSNGRTEKLLLDEGKNNYQIQVTDRAGNAAAPIRGSVYYLPGPIKLLLSEPSALYTVYDGLPPVLHPGHTAAEEPVEVEVEIDDGIGTVPESIRYCKVTGNGQIVVLRNNNDYIYRGKVNVVRGTNIFTIQVEDLSNRLEALKFTVVVK